MNRPHDNPTPAPNAQPRRAFTIVELLVVVGIIIILLSIIIVAVNAAVRTSQGANTQALLTSINQGLVQFRTDIGYLPPVLGTEPPGKGKAPRASRDYYPPPIPPEAGSTAASYLRFEVQPWYSITSLAEYLLGYGDATEDGYGAGNPIYNDQGAPQADGPLGIRHPGSDGYWGLAMDPSSPSKFGTLDMRRDNLANNPGWRRYLQGRSYGPYIELRDDKLLAAVEPNAQASERTGEYQVYFQGDALPPDLTWEDMPKVIVDYWGQPIRYYRKPYMRGNPHHQYRQGLGVRVPTLSDVYVLRPYRLHGGDVIDVVDAPDLSQALDTTTTRTLNAADFALYSAGPSKRADWRYRADPEEYNRDNIVEIGR